MNYSIQSFVVFLFLQVFSLCYFVVAFNCVLESWWGWCSLVGSYANEFQLRVLPFYPPMALVVFNSLSFNFFLSVTVL